MVPQQTDPSEAAVAASDAMPLRRKNRLGVPTAVRKAVIGLGKQRGKQALIADLQEEGRVVFHLAVDMQDELNKQREELATAAIDGDTEALDALSAHEMKYRDVTYWSDGRLILPNAVVAFLGVKPGTLPYLHVRARAGKLEVLSMRYCNDLLSE